MKLWKAVCTTDPDATKRVNQRGGFTAIDAYSQIMAATKQFGPVGKGWGWEIDRIEYPEGCVAMFVKVWHGTRDNWLLSVGQKRLTVGNKADEMEEMR